MTEKLLAGLCKSTIEGQMALLNSGQLSSEECLAIMLELLPYQQNCGRAIEAIDELEEMIFSN